MKRELLLSFAILSLIILGGLSSASAQTPTAAPIAQIRIGCSTIDAEPSPVWVAQEAGFFKNNGLKVEEIVFYRGGAANAQALVSGDIQFAVVSPPAVVDATAGGADVTMIMGLVNTLNFDFIVQPGITKGQGLKGKKLGVSGQTGTSVTATRYALRELFKLNPEKDVRIISIGNENDRIAALQTRQIDGTVLTPDITIKAKKIGLIVLTSLWDKGIPYQNTGVAISRSFASKSPEAVRSFVKSVIEAIAFYKNPDK